MIQLKKDYGGKLENIDKKYFTTSNYNLDEKIQIKKLINKSDISGFINDSEADKKISNKRRNKNRAR